MELIFMYVLMKESGIIFVCFLHVDIQLFQHHLLKKTILSPTEMTLLLKKSRGFNFSTALPPSVTRPASDSFILMNYIFFLNHTMFFHSPVLSCTLPVRLEYTSSYLHAKLFSLKPAQMEPTLSSFFGFASNPLFSPFKCFTFLSNVLLSTLYHYLVIDYFSAFVLNSHFLSPSAWHRAQHIVDTIDVNLLN